MTRKTVPTRAFQNNPRQVGDVVCFPPASNAVGEGVLWRVTKVKGPWINIEPLLTVTGPSKRKPQRVRYNEVRVPDPFVLSAAIDQLRDVVLNVATQLGRS